jgi:hypothetical protein
MGSSEREWTEGGFITREQATTVIRNIGRQYGYAIAHHGTGIRDVDLVAVPWQEKVATPEFLISEVEEALNGIRTGPPELKPHGRLSWAIQLAAVGPPDIWYVDLAVVVPVVERGPEEAMHGYRAGWDAAMRSLGVPIDKRGPLEERERSGDIEEQFSDVLDNMGVIAKGAYDGWRNDLIAALCEVVRGQESFNGLTRAEIEATLSAPEGMADLPREEER